MKKLLRCGWVIGICLLISSSIHGLDFVLDTKKTKNQRLSKNALKEKLGQETKTAFHAVARLEHQLGMVQVEYGKIQAQLAEKKDLMTLQGVLREGSLLNRRLGTLQLELSSLQQLFSRIAEKLVDNQMPFKKADHGVLHDAVSVMQHVGQEVERQVSSCNGVVNDLAGMKKIQDNKHVYVLKTAHSVLQTSGSTIKKLHTQLMNNKCTKVT